MTLYEINKELEAAVLNVLNSVDEETGEVNEDCVQILAELNMKREEKLDNLGAYIKNLLAEADALKAEEERLKARRQVKVNEIERLKEYVKYCLNGEKFESPRVAFSFRESQQVFIPDESKLDAKYLVPKTKYEPDKAAIKKAIKAGDKVEGAELLTISNLQVK